MSKKNNKFAHEGYQISMFAKNVELTDAIKAYVMEKLSKIEKFSDHIIDIMVTLEVQKITHTVSIVMKFLNINIKVHASTEDMYSAIDKATERLAKLIKKYKTKLQSHRVKALAKEMSVNVLSYDETKDINDAIDAENKKITETAFSLPKIESVEKMPLKILKQDEAIMKLELTGKHFIIYKSEEENKLKVIYRHDNGKFAIVEVE
jgi:putative sigma-54 modulation protein